MSSNPPELKSREIALTLVDQPVIAQAEEKPF
jgi:hypothetical protein